MAKLKFNPILISATMQTMLRVTLKLNQNKKLKYYKSKKLYNMLKEVHFKKNRN